MANLALSITSLTLSSTPSETSLYHDVAQSLALYSPQNKRDKTRLILQSFFSQLPKAGSDNICQDIKDCIFDQDLQNLADHLVFHILALRMLLLTLSNI